MDLSGHNLLHLMRAITCAHTSTRATSLMHVENSTWFSYLEPLLCWGVGIEKVKEGAKAAD